MPSEDKRGMTRNIILVEDFFARCKESFMVPCENMIYTRGGVEVSVTGY